MPATGTEMQALFAVAYANNGGNVTQAAIDAGYSEKSAKDLGYRALAVPYVQEMIMAELKRQRSRAGVVGLTALITVAESDKAPPAARVSAGRALLEFAGLVSGAGDTEGDRRAGPAAPDYQSILDTFANISSLAVAARRETVQ